MRSVRKQDMEDLVVKETVKMLRTPKNIEYIAKSIHELHEKETTDNTTLKLLVKRREEAIKASNNLIKAIEQGIINDMTKTRMRELEAEIMQYDFDIEQERQRSYSFLSIEDIEEFLKTQVFDDTDDIKIRKLLINTFVREVILYPDKIVITYKFTDAPSPHKITADSIKETERQITSALSQSMSSYNQKSVSPLTT